MTLTTIDPVPALVVIDLQQGLAAYPTLTPISEIVDRSARLAEAFRRHGLPVVLVNATGRAAGRTDLAPTVRPRAAHAPGWADLIEELGARPGDLRISKQTWGAFHGTALDAQLRERGVTQLVLTGVSTSAGVETTARAAYEHGYHVVLAVDAITDTDAATHDHTVGRIFPKLGQTTTTGEVAAMLDSSR